MTRQWISQSCPYFQVVKVCSRKLGGHPLCHEAEHRGRGRLKGGGCLSPAISRASFGASGRDLDAQANPKGSWHGRLLLVPFSSTWKKMNKFKKLSRKMTEFCVPSIDGKSSEAVSREGGRL
jgi:hypothetical protein